MHVHIHTYYDIHTHIVTFTQSYTCLFIKCVWFILLLINLFVYSPTQHKVWQPVRLYVWWLILSEVLSRRFDTLTMAVSKNGHTGIPQNCCSSRGNDGKPMDLGYFIVRQSHVCQFFLMSVPTWLLPGHADVQGVRHCRHATASQRFSVEVAIHKRLVEGKFLKENLQELLWPILEQPVPHCCTLPLPNRGCKTLISGLRKEWFDTPTLKMRCMPETFSRGLSENWMKPVSAGSLA